MHECLDAGHMISLRKRSTFLDANSFVEGAKIQELKFQFLLFPDLKNWVGGERFENNEEISH